MAEAGFTPAWLVYGVRTNLTLVFKIFLGSPSKSVVLNCNNEHFKIVTIVLISDMHIDLYSESQQMLRKLFFTCSHYHIRRADISSLFFQTCFLILDLRGKPTASLPEPSPKPAHSSLLQRCPSLRHTSSHSLHQPASNLLFRPHKHI